MLRTGVQGSRTLQFTVSACHEHINRWFRHLPIRDVDAGSVATSNSFVLTITSRVSLDRYWFKCVDGMKDGTLSLVCRYQSIIINNLVQAGP